MECVSRKECRAIQGKEVKVMVDYPKGWRPTTREYDPNDPRPINLLHPPKNTPPEVIEALWGGDLGEDPRKKEEGTDE